MANTEIPVYVKTSSGRYELNPAYTKAQEKVTEAPAKKAKATKVKAEK